MKYYFSVILLVLVVVAVCKNVSRNSEYRMALVEWSNYPGKVFKKKIYDRKKKEGDKIFDKITHGPGYIYKFYN